MPKPPDERWAIAADFDGVIHSYSSPWVSADVIPDPPVEGAIEWLWEMVKKFDIVVHTTRAATPEGAAAVLAYLVRHGFSTPCVTCSGDGEVTSGVFGQHHAPTMCLPCNGTGKSGFTPEGITATAVKPKALIYLDDRAVRFEGPGTFPTADDIHRRLRPWNKK